MRRQAVQKTIVKNQNRLNELESEKQSLENVLERTSSLFQKTIHERHQMTETWKAAVQTLNSRNIAIRETIDVSNINPFCNCKFKESLFFQKISQTLILGDRKNIELKEQNEFLEQQIENNQESELAISELNDQISKIRGLLTKYSEDIQLKANELITLRRQMQHDTNCLQQMRQKNHKSTIEYDTKSKEITKLKEIVDELASKIGKIQNEKNNAENRLRHFDELFEDEEKSIHAIEVETARLSQMVYRSTQMIQQQHNEQRMIEVSLNLDNNNCQ